MIESKLYENIMEKYVKNIETALYDKAEKTTKYEDFLELVIIKDGLEINRIITIIKDESLEDIKNSLDDDIFKIRLYSKNIAFFDDTVVYGPEENTRIIYFGRRVSGEDYDIEGDVIICGDEVILYPEEEALTYKEVIDLENQRKLTLEDN